MARPLWYPPFQMFALEPEDFKSAETAECHSGVRLASWLRIYPPLERSIDLVNQKGIIFSFRLRSTLGI